MSPSVEEDEGCEAEAYEGAIRAFCFSKRSDPELEMRNGGGVRLTACLTVESLLGIKRQHWFVVGAIGVESARAAASRLPSPLRPPADRILHSPDGRRARRRIETRPCAASRARPAVSTVRGSLRVGAGLAGRLRRQPAACPRYPLGHAARNVLAVGYYSHASGARLRAARPWITAMSSMRLLVVSGSPPESRFS